mgnify:CR=1 FL=1
MQIHHNRINLDLHRLWEFNDTYLAIKMALAQYVFGFRVQSLKQSIITLPFLVSHSTHSCLIKEFRFFETYTHLLVLLMTWDDVSSEPSVHYSVSASVCRGPGALLAISPRPWSSPAAPLCTLARPRGEGGQPGHWKQRGNVWWSLMITRLSFVGTLRGLFSGSNIL